MGAELEEAQVKYPDLRRPPIRRSGNDFRAAVAVHVCSRNMDAVSISRFIWENVEWQERPRGAVEYSDFVHVTGPRANDDIGYAVSGHVTGQVVTVAGGMEGRVID